MTASLVVRIALIVMRFSARVASSPLIMTLTGTSSATALREISSSGVSSSHGLTRVAHIDCTSLELFQTVHIDRTWVAIRHSITSELLLGKVLLWIKLKPGRLGVHLLSIIVYHVSVDHLLHLVLRQPHLLGIVLHQ